MAQRQSSRSKIFGDWPRNEFTVNRHALTEAEYADIVVRIRAELAEAPPNGAFSATMLGR